MIKMEHILSFIVGLVIGILIMIIIHRFQKKDSEEVVKELFEKANIEKEKNLEIILSKIKESFGSLSHEALIKKTEEFLKLADVSLSKQTQSVVKDFEKDRESKFGQLSEQLQSTAEQTSKLRETTNRLSNALVSTKVRAQ